MILSTASRAAAVIALTTLATASLAQPPQAPPTGEQRAEDIVTQPLDDVNLKKKDIPPVLARAVDDVYSADDTRTCATIAAAVAGLNEALGDDFDAPPPPPDNRDQKREQGAGAVGKAVVNSLIPFRSIVRYVSGADKASQQYNIAVSAGLTRRGYLKGIGRARGCKPPAAPLAQVAAKPAKG